MAEVVDASAVRARLALARRALVLTGAGVSVASGLPTYRGAEDSVYADPARLRDAFGSTLRRDPAAFWARFAPRRAALRAARPNAAHEALAALERGPAELLLATQNIDALHERAGSQRVVELHGNAAREACLAGCGAAPWASSADEDAAAAASPPRCPGCGGVARPDVVLFGEGGDERWAPVRAFVTAGAVDVVLLVGTAGVVEVPGQLVALARETSRPWVVEVNPRPSEALDALVDARVVAPAEVALPLMVSEPPTSADG